MKRTVLIGTLFLLCCFFLSCAGYRPISTQDFPGQTQKDKFIQAGAVTYHYEEYPADGPAIVMVHGFGSSSYTWAEVAPVLQSAGYHVYCLDMYGFGYSDKPKELSYDAKSIMEGVCDWMDAVNLTGVTYVGNSFGGAVGVMLTLDHPEKVDRLVLVDAATYPHKKPLIVSLARMPFAEQVMKIFHNSWIVKKNLKAAAYKDDIVTKERVRAYYNRLSTPNALGAQVAVARTITGKAPFAPYDSRVPEITAPTLIIWGEHDTWIPLANGVRFRHDISDSVLAVLPDCGHIPQEEFPEKTAQLIVDFMTDQPVADYDIQ